MSMLFSKASEGDFIGIGWVSEDFTLSGIPVSKANGGAKSFKGPPRSLSEEPTHVRHLICFASLGLTEG